MRYVIITAALALAGCAATPQDTARAQAAEEVRAQKLAAALGDRVPGQPTDCLSNLPGDRTSRTIGSTILYSDGAGVIYRNDTSGGCEAAERGDAIVTISNGGRLCRGDIARTVDLTAGRIPTGSCALGAFVPYRKP